MVVRPTCLSIQETTHALMPVEGFWKTGTQNSLHNTGETRPVSYPFHLTLSEQTYLNVNSHIIRLFSLELILMELEILVLLLVEDGIAFGRVDRHSVVSVLGGVCRRL